MLSKVNLLIDNVHKDRKMNHLTNSLVQHPCPFQISHFSACLLKFSGQLCIINISFLLKKSLCIMSSCPPTTDNTKLMWETLDSKHQVLGNRLYYIKMLVIRLQLVFWFRITYSHNGNKWFIIYLITLIFLFNLFKF